MFDHGKNSQFKIRNPYSSTNFLFFFNDESVCFNFMALNLTLFTLCIPFDFLSAKVFKAVASIDAFVKRT